MLLPARTKLRITFGFLSALIVTLAATRAASQQAKTFHDLLPEPHTPAELSDYEQKLLNITIEWSKGSDSSPGTSVDVKEIARTSNNGGLTVQYHVFVKGAAKDRLYNLLTWPITQTQPSRTLEGLRLADNGLVMCAGRTPEDCQSPLGKDDPVEVTFTSPGKGEIFREALVSTDNHTKVLFAIVPNPLLDKNKGCVLEAVRLTRQFEVTMLRGSGFKPNESLDFVYKSYDETHETKVSADPNGEFVFSISPFAKGKHGGKGEAKIKSVNCAPTVSFHWGE